MYHIALEKILYVTNMPYEVQLNAFYFLNYLKEIPRRNEILHKQKRSEPSHSCQANSNKYHLYEHS